ncbi:hypothetical protein I1A49_03335 [Streptomyces malaysiensis subsp. malaysiensis]|uniref:Uncharacterized protein n=1 Tax=Streptomyces malaysiensis TaxID=92644 RepID=A0ABX6VZF9_STRMQ|nr:MULTISPECIES: hypothetical protein [Streptomyces]QPI54091.1 hypothetical protein I1A49_03335 [Streptomyces solisilvae]UHH15473.1 hypothetical protein LUV23_03370 [Streptomyces sp. HNM0561]
MEIAAELAAQPPFAVSVAKQVITAATDAPREAALLLEQLAGDAHLATIATGAIGVALGGNLILSPTPVSTRTAGHRAESGHHA